MAKTGRPEKPIDWERVDQLLEAGCSGMEIAPHFDMHYDRFYDRVAKQYSMTFTDYAVIKRQKGESLLREKQYLKALKGDNSMLIWLGKNRLGQKESQDESKLDPKMLDQLKNWMDAISTIQASASKTDSSMIINDI